MCNLYSLTKAPAAIVALIRSMGNIPVGFPDGVPNIEPRDIRISERAPILKAGEVDGAPGLALVERRWSWPGPTGKPVFNFRSEGRRFASADRCEIVADAVYEFTAPAEPGKKTKDRWRFDRPEHDWFGIAGIVRDHPRAARRSRIKKADRPAGKSAKASLSMNVAVPIRTWLLAMRPPGAVVRKSSRAPNAASRNAA